MNFTESIGVSLEQYAIFEGRSSRAEFWYFLLLITVVCGTCFLFGSMKDRESGIVLGAIAMLGLILPLASVLVRRLHDIGRSGHWAWLAFVPGIGAAILAAFCLIKGDTKKNRFGLGFY